MAEHDALIERLTTALRDCVQGAYEYGAQDGDFVAAYITPTGPIHRAIPLLQELGLTVRPRRAEHMPPRLAALSAPPTYPEARREEAHGTLEALALIEGEYAVTEAALATARYAQWTPSRGGLQWEIHSGGYDIEVEITADGRNLRCRSSPPAFGHPVKTDRRQP